MAQLKERLKETQEAVITLSKHFGLPLNLNLQSV